tara:strand:- start:987 stop:1316 length:330 start_codon:yes stop_codon:yes gene_type:complete
MTYHQSLSETIKLQCHFVGIPRITKKNYTEYYKRGKMLQALGVGFMQEGRMPTLSEVRDNIGTEIQEAKPLNANQWKFALFSIVEDLSREIIKRETSLEKTMDKEVVAK